ncbi:hypothetical protein N7450_009214 [Penicillium hetheringtonii]|uniref:Amidohydrolase-related domain-containing protein n=1 Tax=Penicillium hetheringtonii TaxID=911720 RepID=A0AAD6DEI8_9EURO|nr:hypothetical protein N7450_009214 [Penicillium hetheringtonii]
MPPTKGDKIGSIRGIKLPGSSTVWDINIDYPSDSPQGRITSITPHDSSSSAEFTGTGSDRNIQTQTQTPLALPSLVHPHIHLDKAFIHSEPQYEHLLPVSGSFHEALSFTAAAKKQFTLPDLIKRGEWLLAESVSAGVTAMRAFVEVDHVVKLTCVEAAVRLKKRWSENCEVQIVCFAQDPIFSTENADQNLDYIEEALEKYSEIEVIGTTPYVETSIEKSKQNIEWAITRAMQLDKHVDFHLDYNLEEGKEALVWHVLHTLIRCGWTTQSISRQIMLGHCTRLTLFTKEEWTQIAHLIQSNDLPVTFVGLPTSDLYMASPPSASTSGHSRVRGTLPVPDLIRDYGLDAVIGVNNLGNAFTPWGTVDPLFLACLGVGVYQAGTRADAELLYECVSTRARAAIGLEKDRSGFESMTGLCVKEGESPNLVLFCDRDLSGCGISRPRRSVAEIVWSPPSGSSRDVIFKGTMERKT